MRFTMMVNVKTAIKDIEKRAKLLGIPIRKICTTADVAPSNWNRWKTGQTTPTFGTWERIDRATRRLLPEAAE